MEDKKRFSYHATISIRDKLDGTTVVCHMSVDEDTKEKIVAGIEFDLIDIFYRVSKAFPDEFTKEDIQKKITNLKQEKKWGNRRIINWFKKFGIEIELPTQGTLKGGQSFLN